MNRRSRSSLEMKDPDCRPALADMGAPLEEADLIFLGYPVWWYREPSVIDSFLASYDFSGKRIVPFVTSGSSEIGEEAPARMREITGARVEAGRRFSPRTDPETLKAWASGFIHQEGKIIDQKGKGTGMKIAVRYYTKTGNTKRLAEAVAEAAGVKALPISEPLEEAADILFLGNSYYAFSIDPEVRDFIRSLDPEKIGRIVNFGTAALLNSTWKKVKAEAEKKGIAMDEREFHCRGEFKGMHKGRPNKKDLEEAAAFVRSVISE